jgi:cell division protein FtsZ
MFEIEEVRNQSARIKVFGIGGAGGNAVNNMIGSNLKGIDFIAINTDLQVLETSLAPEKIQIGAELTRGLGAGSDPEIGREAAMQDAEAIAEKVQGADMVFITAGMGGGTGTGASPVVASIAKEAGALTVAVVTKPFFYEGKKRALNAEEGIKELREHVDTIIVIPNDRISLVVEKGTPLLKSFSVANDVLKQAVQGISDLILVPGLINLDFADVRTVMSDAGRAVIGIGTGSGDNSATVAAKKAISNPLLEDSSIDGTRRMLINITGGIDLSLDAIQEATGLIFDSAHEDANIIFGSVIDPDMKDEVRVTVIATGFESRKKETLSDEVKVKPWKPSMMDLPNKKSRLRGSKKVLSKTMEDMLPLPEDILSYDDPHDMPAFMRRSE